jgi:hypothetical protein
MFIVRTESVVPAAPTVDADLLPTPTPAGAPAAIATPAPGGEQPPVVLPAAGGFNGVFAGTLSAEDGSSAPAVLELSQSGEAVTGRLTIDNGLTLDVGNCGTQAVPPGTQTAAGRVDPANPNRAQAQGSIEAGGFTIGVALTIDLATDGRSATAGASLDLPLICGRDPSISGNFVRE